MVASKHEAKTVAEPVNQSEAGVPSQSIRIRRLSEAKSDSCIGIGPEFVDVRAIGLEPARVALAQLALAERPALPIGVPG